MVSRAPVPLDPARVNDAADILVRSFVADPGLLFVLPDPADRARLAPTLAQAVLQYVVRCGTPLTTPGAVCGVALWFAPDAPAPKSDDLTASGIGQVPALIGPAAWARFQRLLNHLDALHPR